MRGYSPETISPRTASSSTKVDNSWGSGGGGVGGVGEYIYTYTTDMESNIILNCIETRGGGGLHEHYTHQISNSLFQSQTKSEIIFIYSVSVVVEILN